MVLYATKPALQVVPCPNAANLLQEAANLVLNSVSSSGSRRVYRVAIDEFIPWAGGQHRPFTKATVNEYRCYLESRRLSPSTINGRFSVIRDAVHLFHFIFRAHLCPERSQPAQRPPNLYTTILQDRCESPFFPQSIDALSRIPTHSIQQLDQLLPHAWAAARS